jgi:hypothetical protein
MTTIFLMGIGKAIPPNARASQSMVFPAITVLLRIRSANSAIARKANLFPRTHKLCADQIDVTVGCILVCDRLHHERIICAEHSSHRKLPANICGCDNSLPTVLP